jgi:hypothetical protein
VWRIELPAEFPVRLDERDWSLTRHNRVALIDAPVPPSLPTLMDWPDVGVDADVSGVAVGDGR